VVFVLGKSWDDARVDTCATAPGFFSCLYYGMIF